MSTCPTYCLSEYCVKGICYGCRKGFEMVYNKCKSIRVEKSSPTESFLILIVIELIICFLICCCIKSCKNNKKKEKEVAAQRNRRWQ